MTGEMSSCASLSGYGSVWVKGGGQILPSAVAVGCAIADGTWGHTMPCSVLMFLLRHSFWDQALYLCLGTGPSREPDMGRG